MTVLVNGKKVIAAPGLRFGDEKALALARRNGWIIGWSKLEDLQHAGVFVDWISKEGMEPKLKHFTNSLLKLEETRLGSTKIKLTLEQRNAFAHELCEDLIRPTGVEPGKLLKDGYFVLRNLCEPPNKDSHFIELRKRELAEFQALPPIIVTALAMKELSSQNNLLELESNHETSSILFNPSIRNSTVSNPVTKSIIAQEYDDLVGDISNISLDSDIAIGAMNSLLEQTAVTTPDAEDLSALERTFSAVQDNYLKGVKSLQLHENKLNMTRTGMEDEFLSKQARYEVLNNTIAERNKEVALCKAEKDRLEQEIEIIVETKDSEIAEVTAQLEEAREAIQRLKTEGQDKVSVETLFAVEDEKAELQEQIEAQQARERKFQVKLENIKIEANYKVENLKRENRALEIKEEKLEQSLRKEQQTRKEMEDQLTTLRTERDDLQTQRDNIELTLQKMQKEARRLSTTHSNLEDLKHRLSSSEEVFGSPKADTTTFVQKLVAPEFTNPSYIMSTTELNSKTVQQMVPKWTASENVRNYTKRLTHAWEFVKKDAYDEKKFLDLVRISVSANLGEIIDNFLEEQKNTPTNITIDNLCKTLNTKLDKRPSEYITEFKAATKSPNESYNAFAHRLTELYKKGTETKGNMGSGEKRLIVEQFLEGLPYAESSTLKMVATDAELLDVDQLALRAARSGKPRKNRQKCVIILIPNLIFRLYHNVYNRICSGSKSK